jgi:hypothetical protein
MAYSCSLEFSDQFSCRKHFISNYHLKDMNFASLKHLQQFSENREKRGPFSHPERASP